MQVGTTKDQGVYNKPSAAVHPGALAAGTLPQYSTILSQMIPFQFRPPCSVSIRFNIILTSASSYLAVRFSDRNFVCVPKLFRQHYTLSSYNPCNPNTIC